MLLDINRGRLSVRIYKLPVEGWFRWRGRGWAVKPRSAYVTLGEREGWTPSWLVGPVRVSRLR